MSAYADIDPSGLRVSAAEREPWVQFGDDARIGLQFPCLGSVGVSIYGSMALVHGWAGPGQDRAYLVSRSGTISDLGPVVGTNAVALTAAGPCVIRSERKYTVNGVELDVPTDHTGESIYGQGWTQISNTGEPNWFDMQGVITLGGVRFTRWSRVEHWTVGLDATSGAQNRSIAHDARADRVYLIREGTFIAPHVAVSPDGSCEVALSLPAEWVKSSEFQPYTASAVTIPAFRPAGRAIGVGYFFDADDPQSIPGPLGPDKVPVAFDTRDPDALGLTGMAMVQQMAREAGVPYGLYIDRYGLRPTLVPAGGRAMLFCYPQRGVPLAVTIGAAKADMRAVRDAGVPFDLVVATYCQYRSPGIYALREADVLATLAAMWDAALEYGAGAVWCFAKTRNHDGTLVDGADYWPNIAEAVRRMRAASDNPRLFPGRLAPIPVPAPVPVPSPVPEDPMSTKKLTIALRRDFDPPRFLSVTDDRQAVDTRLAEPTDPRTHFVPHIFDQPGQKPGQWAAGNKVALQSAQDGVFLSPKGDRVVADLNLAGIWEIRAGEFPNTWDLLVPVAERAVTANPNKPLSIESYKTPLWSLHGFRPFNAATQQEIVGPF